MGARGAHGVAHALAGRGAIAVVVDRDDDDANGQPDAEEEVVAPAARVDLVSLDRALVGWELHPIRGADKVRLIASSGRAVPWGRAVPLGGMIQGLAPGSVQIVASRGKEQLPLSVEVTGIGFRDGARMSVDPARDHASIERTPPTRVEGTFDASYDDPDALRIWAEVPEDAREAGPPRAAVESISAGGHSIDLLAQVAMAPVPCGRGAAGLRCFASAPIRFVMDDVDRTHPLGAGRSVRAEVGGAVLVREQGRKLQAIRVLGPRRTAAGPIKRLRATIRPFVLRTTVGGVPAIGGNDAGAIAALRAELALASSIWGQCGVTFGPANGLDVRIAAPPSPFLVAIGDDAGLPATGGDVRFRAEGHQVHMAIARGSTPDRVAAELTRVLEKSGLVVTISPNARIAPGAGASVDLLVRRRDGQLATLEPLAPGASVTTDATLAVRIGSVDMSDGLQHFGDMDSVAGTLEERTLLKSIDDGDPHTVEVVVVPSFAGGGRIGESFIASDLSSLRNVVLLDRAGVRARRSSLTLAHELGHVLLDQPGHPDDYGLDTPTLLMDSDASDASPFGPRRLTLDECARVLRQAGPKARVPLLTDWPIGPLRYPISR